MRYPKIHWAITENTTRAKTLVEVFAEEDEMNIHDRRNLLYYRNSLLRIANETEQHTENHRPLTKAQVREQIRRLANDMTTVYPSIDGNNTRSS